jgi:hypothetical protein
VLFVKPHGFIVVDDVTGKGEHAVDVNFQLAPVEVTVGTDQWIRARAREGGALLVRTFASVPFKTELYEGDTEPMRGWVSPDYGVRLRAPILTFAVVAPLPVRHVTLLVPLADPHGPPPAVSASVAPAGPVTISFPGRGERVRLDGAGFTLERM